MTPPTSAEKMFLNGFDLTECGSCGRKVAKSFQWLVVRNGEDEIVIVQCPNCRNPVAEIRACETCTRRWALLARPPKFQRQRRRFCSWRCDGGKELPLTAPQLMRLKAESEANEQRRLQAAFLGGQAEPVEPTQVGRMERAL